MPKYKKSPTIHATPFLQRKNRLPTPRRLKVLAFLLVTVVFYLFYRSSGSPENSDLTDEFYQKTKSALQVEQKQEHDHSLHDVKDKGVKDDEDDGDLATTKKMSERLKQAAQVAKDNANAKMPKPDAPSDVIGVGSAAIGGKKDKDKIVLSDKVGKKENLGVAGAGGTGRKSDQKVVKGETKEDHEVEELLNSILKKSPIIIFSKSYCPHSKRAKDILLDKYIINPAPFVVELNEIERGLEIQARLADLTNRMTVPNVLINGVSIGGGDDIAELDETKKLVEKIKEFGGKKIIEARPRAGSNREREKEKEKPNVVRGSDHRVG